MRADDLKGNDFGETAYLFEEGQVEVSKKLDGQTVHLGPDRFLEK
jgi:hypothetical protein